MNKPNYFPMMNIEVKKLVDDIRRNLTAIELNENNNETENSIIIDCLVNARTSMEHAALFIKD